MATHYCPSCGSYSFHGEGAAPWALRCPACGVKTRQHPHPPPATPAGPAAESVALLDPEESS